MGDEFVVLEVVFDDVGRRSEDQENYIMVVRRIRRGLELFYHILSVLKHDIP